MPLKDGRIYCMVPCTCGKTVEISSGSYGSYCTSCAKPVFTSQYREELNKEIRETIHKEKLKTRKGKKTIDYSVANSTALSICNLCGANLDSGLFFIVDGEIVCKVCYDTKIPKCKGCGSRHFKQYLKGGLCEGCVESFGTCQGCGNTYDKRVLKEFEIDGRKYCNTCVENYNGAKGIFFQSYSYKPSPVFLGDREVGYYYGIELEIDNSKRRQELMAKAHCDEVYFKSDSSLVSGVEIVTHPATLYYHMNELPWKMILNAAKSSGYKSHKGASGDRNSNHPTCGLHIHVSREAFGHTPSERDTRQAKLLVLVDKFWSKLVFFSRRDSRSLENWAKRYANFDVANDQLSEIIHKAKQANSGDRRLAVNFGHSGSRTVEFRFFRGTLNYETIIASIQLIDLLVEATLLPTEEVQTMTWAEFCIMGEKHSEFTGYLNRLREMKRDI